MSKTRRAPNGMDSRKPVAMRLTTQEKTELEALAGTEQRSVGSLARLFYLRGLHAYRSEADAARIGGSARPAVHLFAEPK